MKKALFLLPIVAVFVISCKVKPASESKLTASNKTEFKNESMEVNNQVESKTLGMVSHKYKATGCNTVIEVKLPTDGEIQTLIPKDKLPADVDVEGTLIYFNYLLLRMPQPAGCSTGQPASITDIEKKK
jgi:hypothetical protein